MHYTMDTETDRQGEFRLGVVMDERRRAWTFTSKDAMREHLSSLNGVCWGHNVSYDLLVLWRGALGAWFLNGEFRKAKLGGLEFRDTFSFFAESLAEAATRVGMQKTGEGRASWDYDVGTLGEYCRQDCLVTFGLVDAVRGFALRHGTTDRATGPGAWARALWARSNPKVADYPDDLQLGKRVPRGIVRGGLVKHVAGQIAEGEKWDVKSAYPWQMVSGLFPDLRSIERRCGQTVLLQVADAGWFLPEERELLRMRGRVLRQLRVSGAWGNPFERFIERVMKDRNRCKREGDRAGDYLTKRVMNSLTGCLGARTQATYVRSGVASGGSDENPIPGTRSLWAALVTGRQRCRVLRAWERATDPLYSDTDSLVCKRFDPDGEGDDACGRWELEERFYEAYVLGPKAYATLDRNGRALSAHVKGVPRREAARLIQAYREHGETACEWDSVASYREAFRAPTLWLRRKRDPFVKLRREQGEPT